MKKVLRFVFGGSILLVLPGLLLAAEVDLIVKGTVWDSDSRGFAWYQRLSKNQGTIKAARRGARVSLDGRPEVFAISGKGGSFNPFQLPQNFL